jgi:thiol-disulfide isomerase/thioredoxin
MKKNAVLIVFLAMFILPILSAQTIQKIKLIELKEILEPTNDSTIVVNFWASWCVACVKELPYFEQIHQMQKNVKIILIAVEDTPEKALNILKKKKITIPNTLFLDETDANLWINAVDKNWDGAIPYTIVFKKKERKNTHQGELTLEELKQIVE